MHKEIQIETKIFLKLSTVTITHKIKCCTSKKRKKHLKKTYGGFTLSK